jgi:DNA (cytosine-5)-methyltransferase 1
MRYKRYTLADLEESASRKKFNVVSFFSGGGGSSCGYKLAGGDMICVNEFQQVHADTYSANFPNTPVIVDDIKKVTPARIREQIGDVEIDILDGSPPCPPFSMSGTKQKGWGKEKMAYGFKQERIEDLTFEQIRIVGELKPKVVVCENVKGLTMRYASEYLKMMITEFEKVGYNTDYQVLNSWQFGVPQKRERVFIVSVRNDIYEKIKNPLTGKIDNIFPMPEALNKGNDRKIIKDPRPTIEDAIRDIQDDPKNIKEGEELCASMKKGAKYKWLRRLQKNPERVVSVGDNVVKPWYEKLIDHRIQMIEKIKGYSKPIPPAKFSFFQSRRVPWNQASHTLSEQGLKTSLAVHLHPEEDRGYTTYEAARIMTLPDDYKQTGSLNDRLARIGLMVAPMCLKHLAESIYENVLEPYANS